MMAQKNHKNKATTDNSTSSSKKMIYFEVLWRCISKIWNGPTRCIRGGIIKEE